MARLETEIVHLLTVKRYGSTMSKQHYDTVAHFIISTLESERDNMINLNDLIEKAKNEIQSIIHADEVPWYILNVKQDLEAKKIIKVSVQRGRRQYLRLIKRVRIEA